MPKLGTIKYFKKHPYGFVYKKYELVTKVTLTNSPTIQEHIPKWVNYY